MIQRIEVQVQMTFTCEIYVEAKKNEVLKDKKMDDVLTTGSLSVLSFISQQVVTFQHLDNSVASIIWFSSLLHSLARSSTPLCIA